MDAGTGTLESRGQEAAAAVHDTTVSTQSTNGDTRLSQHLDGRGAASAAGAAATWTAKGAATYQSNQSTAVANPPQRTPDGTVRSGDTTLRPDGSAHHPEFDRDSDGTTTVHRDGQSWTFDSEGRLASSTTDAAPPVHQSEDGSTAFTASDGTTLGLGPDGSVTSPDGWNMNSAPDGTVRVDSPAQQGQGQLSVTHHPDGEVSASSSDHHVSGTPGREATATTPDGTHATSTPQRVAVSDGEFTTYQSGDSPVRTEPTDSPGEPVAQHDGNTGSAPVDDTTTAIADQNGSRVTPAPDNTSQEGGAYQSSDSQDSDGGQTDRDTSTDRENAADDTTTGEDASEGQATAPQDREGSDDAGTDTGAQPQQSSEPTQGSGSETQQNDPAESTRADRPTQSSRTTDANGTTTVENTYTPTKGEEPIDGPRMQRNPDNDTTSVDHQGFHMSRTPAGEDGNVGPSPQDEFDPTSTHHTTVRPSADSPSATSDGVTGTRVDGDGITVTRDEEADTVHISGSEDPNGPSSPTPGRPDVTWSTDSSGRSNNLTISDGRESLSVEWQRGQEPRLSQPQSSESRYHVSGPDPHTGQLRVVQDGPDGGSTTTIDRDGNVSHTSGSRDRVDIDRNGTATTHRENGSESTSIRQFPNGEMDVTHHRTSESGEQSSYARIGEQGETEARLRTTDENGAATEKWGVGVDENGQATTVNNNTWTDGPTRLRPDGSMHNVDATENYQAANHLQQFDSQSKLSTSEKFNAVLKETFLESMNQIGGLIQTGLEEGEVEGEDLEQAVFNLRGAPQKGLMEQQLNGQPGMPEQGAGELPWRLSADIAKLSQQDRSEALTEDFEEMYQEEQDEQEQE